MNQSKPPLSKPAKTEPKSIKGSHAFEKNHGPPTSTQNSKKKTKNVFRDDSDESSSSSSEDNAPCFKEEEAPYFKATKKQGQSYESTSKMEVDDLIEAVPGVFVTQKQLNMMADKYGKVKEIREP